MIATWMLYSLLVGVLVAAAARCAESVLRLLDQPVRWVWAAAVILSLGIPLGAALAPAPIVEVQEVPANATSTALTAGEPVTFSLPGLPAIPSLDRPLLLAWGGLTLALLGTLLYSIGRLQGRRREWQQDTVDGHPVLLASDLGPAVVGWWRMQIVVPAWVHRLDADSRALVLAHEEEHIRAHDPRLLGWGLLAAILVPWHLPLWYAWRRLRTAIELDCDARVLDRGTSRRAYGELLLSASRLATANRLPALVTFAERLNDLETRLTALAPTPVRWRPARILAAGSVAAVLILAACTMDGPLGLDLTEHDIRPLTRSQGEFVLASNIRLVQLFVHRLVEQRYPGSVEAGGTSQPVVALLVLDRERQILRASVYEGSRAPHEEIGLGNVMGSHIDHIEVLRGGVVGLENVSVILIQTRREDEPRLEHRPAGIGLREVTRPENPQPFVQVRGLPK